MRLRWLLHGPIKTDNCYQLSITTLVLTVGVLLLWQSSSPAQTSPGPSPSGRGEAKTYAGQHRDSTGKYDPGKTTTNADSSRTTTFQDGWTTVERKNALGETVWTTRNANGRMMEEITVDANGHQIANYIKDGNQEDIYVRDANGKVTDYTHYETKYDEQGRIKSFTSETHDSIRGPVVSGYQVEYKYADENDLTGTRTRSTYDPRTGKFVPEKFRPVIQVCIVPREHFLRVPTGNSLGMLKATGKVEIDSMGTGETIGHIADLTVQNLTDQPINCAVGPMVLESKSRNQDYVCPKPQTATIEPHGTTTVPMDGVCINRNKPPVGKGVPGDLVVNTGDPTIPQSPDSHIASTQARDLLRICTANYEAAEKLQKDGAFKDFPYKDKEKQKQIAEQWSTWMDPRISEITGAPPATKDDLKKVVYKQLEEQGPMSPETKKKVDKGIDTIFEKVELTTAKAKDLEKPDQYAQTELSSGTSEISSPQGGPGEICLPNPLCFRYDAEFNPKTIRVTSVELYNPNAANKDETWARFDLNLLSTQGKEAAEAALKRVAKNGQFDIDCVDKDCNCEGRGQKWSQWSNWTPVEIYAGFSIPNPNPPPGRLRYRANGEIDVRSRVSIGTCYRIQL